MAVAPPAGWGWEATTVNVNVRTIGLIRMLLGRGDLPLSLPDGASIDELLAGLRELGGDKLAPYLALPKEETAYVPVRVMVNGRDIVALQGRKTRLQENDDVLIFIPIAGG